MKAASVRRRMNQLPHLALDPSRGDALPGVVALAARAPQLLRPPARPLALPAPWLKVSHTERLH